MHCLCLDVELDGFAMFWMSHTFSLVGFRNAASHANHDAAACCHEYWPPLSLHLTAGVWRGAWRPRQTNGPDRRPVCVPPCQSAQQSDPVFRRDGPVPEDCALRQESGVHTRLHLPVAQHHAHEPRSGHTVRPDARSGWRAARRHQSGNLPLLSPKVPQCDESIRMLKP